MKRLLHLSLGSLLLSGSFFSCIEQGILGSGNPRTESRDLNSFSAVAIYNGFEFTYTENNQRSIPIVRMTIDDNLSPFVLMTVTNNELNVSLSQPVSSANRRIEIEGPPLTGIRLFGRSKGSMSRWVSRQPVRVEVSANSSLEIGALEANSAQFSVTGQSTVNITGGAVSSVNLQVSSRSSFLAEAMKTQRVDATLTDRAIAKVNVLTLLNASLSSSSELGYSGNPQTRPMIQDRDSRLTPLDLG